MQGLSYFNAYFAKSTLQNREYLQNFSTLHCIVV